ncbi:solute carrier organic anion transporter family member 4C1 isoform X2 [Anolis carolinensis]|uniref:solute carrier organic anion transporter family member 4C1 isoform X2 n=1 Tax=Anolis carolinensis TaxID=28377 RepID=UPI002F2B407C
MLCKQHIQLCNYFDLEQVAICLEEGCVHNTLPCPNLFKGKHSVKGRNLGRKEAACPALLILLSYLVTPTGSSSYRGESFERKRCLCKRRRDKGLGPGEEIISHPVLKEPCEQTGRSSSWQERLLGQPSLTRAPKVPTSSKRKASWKGNSPLQTGWFGRAGARASRCAFRKGHALCLLPWPFQKYFGKPRLLHGNLSPPAMKKDGVDNPAFEPGSPDRVGAAAASDTAIRGSFVSEYIEDELCGFGGYAPVALQLCNNAKGYLVFYSLLSVFQGIVVNGLINVSISTIEKRYDLNSSLTGVISAGYDISFCILCLFISFYGERGHKPRWLAFASFLIALGSLVFSLPHFTSGVYTYGEKIEDICPIPESGIHNGTCTGKRRSTLTNYFFVFLLAQLILGAGGTPLYTLGTTFIDDSVPKHQASVYIGIGYAMSLLGPAIGYVLGGQLLNVYVDFNRQVSIDITPTDPRWVGAWWIAFVVCCFATCLLVAPFSYFPKHLPGTQQIQAEKISEAHGGIMNVDYTGSNFKNLILTLWMLLHNPVLMCLVVAASLEALVATGFATFLPKFIENQFGYTSSYSATLGGLVLVPGAAIGQIISGTLISKLKMSCKNIIRFILLTCLVALLLNTVFAFAKCGNEPFAGVSETYNGTGTLSNLVAPCNAHCRCMPSEFVPVCGADEVQYFSPCYAGCTSSILHKKTKVYNNCSCVGNPTVVIENTIQGALPGKCKSKCTVLPWFLSFFFLAVVFTFMAVTPTTVAILRCVPETTRSFAMGVHMLFLRIIGTIPGPILFGVAIDHSCTLWSVDKCGIRGSCWTYNNSKMAYMLMGITWMLYKPLANSASANKDETGISVQL